MERVACLWKCCNQFMPCAVGGNFSKEIGLKAQYGAPFLTEISSILVLFFGFTIHNFDTHTPVIQLFCNGYLPRVIAFRVELS